MEYYIKRFSALFCLVAVLTSNGADAQVTIWASVTAGSDAVADVSTALDSTEVGAGSATGTAGVTLRDGLVNADGTLLTVMATSVKTLTYDIDTASQTTFEITGAPGVIKVKAGVSISQSATSTYTVTVTATEVTPDTDSGILTLAVTVNGMPIFSATPNCLNIADATTLGTTLYTYTIGDPESDTVTTTIAILVKYIYNPGGDTSTYFTSTITAGELVTAKVMAKATEPAFTLGIKAVDDGTPPSTASTTVTVNVLDTGALMGKCPTLGETCAIDAGCTTVANAICGSDTAKVCECDAANGYIVNAGTCEKSAAVACPNGDSDCTTTGEICGPGPTCAATDITQIVGTDVTVSTALGVIVNKDGTTTLTLEENYATTITTFTFSSSTSMTSPFTWTSSNDNIEVSTVNEVTLKSGYTLDYETETPVTAVLTAIDSTTPAALTATVSLTLSLTDVNDNPPIFSSATYTDRVADGAIAGKVATTVTATDADGTTANNAITYSITDGNTGVAWGINTNGVVSVAATKTMDNATTSSYSLEVTATDSGSTPKSATVTVVINVATACTSNTDCTTASEKCNTVNGANVCICKTGYVDNSGTCVADCPSVPTQQNGEIGAGSNSVGSTRTVTCDSDYTLTGLATITCQTDSTWETPGTCNGAVSMLAGMILLSLSSLVAMVIYI